MGVQYYGDTLIGWHIDRKKLTEWIIKNKRASQPASSSQQEPEKKVDSDFDTEYDSDDYEEDIDIEDEIFNWKMKLSDKYKLLIKSYNVYNDHKCAMFYLGVFGEYNRFELSEVPIIQSLLETPPILSLALELGANTVSPIITSDAGKC